DEERRDEPARHHDQCGEAAAELRVGAGLDHAEHTEHGCRDEREQARVARESGRHAESVGAWPGPRDPSGERTPTVVSSTSRRRALDASRPIRDEAGGRKSPGRRHRQPHRPGGTDMTTLDTTTATTPGV